MNNTTRETRQQTNQKPCTQYPSPASLIRFRSTHEQLNCQVSLAEEANGRRKQRSNKLCSSYSFWRSGDFRIIVTCAIVSLIAAIIYYTMKG